MVQLTGSFLGIGDAPSVLSIAPLTDNSVRVTFTQQMNPTLTGTIQYTVNEVTGSRALTVVTASAQNLVNPLFVDLTFNTEMTNGLSNYSLVFSSSIQNLSGDSLSPLSASYSGYGIPPYLSAVSIPTSMAGSPTQNITFNILDATSGVNSGSLNVFVQQGSGGLQQAIQTGSFTTGYNGASSSISVFGNGYQVVIDPTGSLGFEISLVVSALDNSFNIFSGTVLACDDPTSIPGRIVQVPQAETLVLHWDFGDVFRSENSSDGLATTSDAKFIVKDVTSGSLQLTSSYHWLGPIRHHQYPGQGDFYLPYDVDATQTEYVYSAKQLPAEVVNSANLVEIRTEDDDLFTRETRPIKHFYAIEKSMYAVISEEIMKLFATITDFNNLIGEPVNRYRQNYKDLEKLRALYFSRIQNETMDFEKFVDYFKWFDSSISQMIQQLIPASANFSSEIRTMVESHILERNKYWTKFPTVEFKSNIPIGGVKGINELLYNYKDGSAPIPLTQSVNTSWWKNRAEKTGVNSSGQTEVDTSRTAILAVSIATLNRSFTTPIRLLVNKQESLSGSISPIRIANIKNSRSLQSISASVRDAHQPLGNYVNDYEIVQTSGRTINNRFFVKSDGAYGANLSSPVSGAGLFTLPQRSGSSNNKYIFAERFSSPGESRTMSRGYLDQMAEEFSSYNDLNFRNSVVRNSLNSSSSLRSEQFGITSGTVNGHYHKVNRNTSRKIEETGSTNISYITASVYDNNFVSRPIPQSELQYSWITGSIDTFSNTVLGLASNFTSVSGSSSVYSPQLAFLSASQNFGNLGTPIDFSGMNTVIFDPLDINTNMLSASNNIYTGTVEQIARQADTLNALLLKRNGPYQYSSWKQIRTAEHPVVRGHRANNIISILDPAKERLFLTPSGDRVVYKDKRGDTFTNYVESPISTRNKPLIHSFVTVGSDLPTVIRHSYSNNISWFSNSEINNKLGLEQCEPQLYNVLKDMYLNSDIGKENNSIEGFLQLSYSEVIYPKGKNAFLQKTRARTEYAEDAPTELRQVYNFYNAGQVQIYVPVAVGNYESNGIDRNPLERRTFWRDSPRDRNRWALIDESTNTAGSAAMRRSGAQRTTLINSQGIIDGASTSVWPFGIELYHTQSNKADDDGNSAVMGTYQNYDFGELAPLRGRYAENSGPDADWDFWQNRSGLVFGTGSVPEGYYFYQYPTCSALYSKQVWPDHAIWDYSSPHDIVTGPPYTEHADDFNHRFRVSHFAGKNPAFDSYEKFAEDVRPMAKDYSIIPEFNISNNMDFYVKQNGGNFRKRNDKFLSNVGASITQSALTEQSGFNEDFFASFSHTDHLVHLDKIVNEHDNADIGINKITFTCKGIKKLLPYNGFYPCTRTTQLASLFSQSYAPHIGGERWFNGATTDPSISNKPSGNLAVAALMQPFFAPGMLFNSIKAGIAMDFPVFRGGVAPAGGVGASTFVISEPPNYRLQFESLLDLKDGSGLGGVPISASDGTGRIYWQGVEYLGSTAYALGLRPVYFDWNGGESSPLYRLAMHNFLAESVNFFLKDEKLKVISSKPINKTKSMLANRDYYMDVVLKRSDDLLMYGGRWNNVNKLYHTASVAGGSATPGINLTPEYAALSYTGKYFGHPFRYAQNSASYGTGIASFGYATPANSHIRTMLYSDGAYAPYLPPYYFKDSIARIKYTSDGMEKNQADPLSYILSKITASYLSPGLLKHMLFYNSNSESDVYSQASWVGRSAVSSSINLFGVAKGFKTSFNPVGGINSSKPATISSVEDVDATYNSWVISPKFESCILNFNNQPDEKYELSVDDDAGVVTGHRFFVPKGMWSGYGEFCTGDTGVFLSVEESFPDLSPVEREVLNSYSLKDVMGFESDKQRLGEVANKKVISEAVIAIPFIDENINSEGVAQTTNIMGRNFFSISQNLFDLQANRSSKGEAAVKSGEFGNTSEIMTTSITELIEKMQEYVIPPELNFLKFKDIKPFAMYIFEFKHALDQQDVADIWQGVMPKIAMTAEKDEISISHEMRPWEFFEGKKLPPNVRWMIFKAKKQAATNYYEKTADSKDDTRFKFDFEVGSKAPEYSYNWPYDYFSLVELAKIEAQVDITPLPKNITNLNPIEFGGASNSNQSMSTTIASSNLVTKKEQLKEASLQPTPKTNILGRKEKKIKK